MLFSKDDLTAWSTIPLDRSRAGHVLQPDSATHWCGLVIPDIRPSGCFREKLLAVLFRDFVTSHFIAPFVD